MCCLSPPVQGQWSQRPELRAPVTKGDTQDGPAHVNYLELSNSERREGAGWSPGPGCGRDGCCFLGVGLRFREVSVFWRRTARQCERT